MNPYAEEQVAGRRIVLDRLDRDGAALASILRDRGADVWIADHAPEADAPEGVTVVHERAAAAQRADLLLVDCWTPETAAHVMQARERGILVGSLADLVLHEWPTSVIGVTGTAGKTMTARLIAHLLAAAGWDVMVPPTGRAENAWPSADTLADLADGRTPDVLVLELTSTHLAYMSASPTIAVVTSLGADHAELHGGEGRYFATKQRILVHQEPGDTAVLPRDTAALVPRTGVQVIRFDDADPQAQASRVPPHHRSNVACAVAVVRDALGVDVEQEDIDTFRLPAWRGECIGRIGDVAVFHDGMAATPMKAAAFVRALPDRSSVLIVGGLADMDHGPVHASPAEQRLLREACVEFARAAQRIVLIGPAAARVAPLLAQAGAVDVQIGPDLHWAAAETMRDLEGVGQIAWVPAFPVELQDRERFADLISSAARGAGRDWAPGAADAK
ncbi:MAG: Mur ligase family protein [Gaiellales bacterium]